MEHNTQHLMTSLLAVDDGNVFFYAALVAIAFISWVVGRIRDAIEAFRQRQRNQSLRQRQQQMDGGITRSTAGHTATAPPTRKKTGPGHQDHTETALRATYRALGIPFPEEDEAVSEEVDREDLLTRDEREALNNQRQQEKAKTEAREAKIVTAAPPIASSFRHQRADRSARGPAGLRKLLRNRSAVRQAILLKEILDPPKALRKES